MDKLDYCGIEVSAEELLIAVRRGDTDEPTRSFPNTDTGHQALVRHLHRAGRSVRVCLESTGLYGLDVALALHAQAEIEVMMVNPRAARHFADALMRRSKTDPLDARGLREFAARMPFQRWQPPSLAARQLCAIARRIAAVVDQCTAEKNRLHAALATQTTPASISRDLKRSIAALQQSQQRLQRDARRLIRTDAQLEQRWTRLLQIRGVAEASALAIVAELGLLSLSFDVRQVVAHAGLDVRHYQSGSSVLQKPRISKAGNRHLRRALYMPALVACRHEPHFRAYYQHLLERGKAKMQALVAVMRKLLHAIWGMFKHDQPFDADKVYRIPPAHFEPAALNRALSQAAAV
jgi:transposase